MGALTIPNVLTYFRMAASVVLFVYGLQGRWEVAYPMFLIAAATDLIDGTLARLLGQRTRLGAILDPVADKVLMFASFLTLTLRDLIPVPITALVFARDAYIGIGMIILKRRRARIIYQPTYLSKLTTLFQILTVFGAFWGAFSGASEEGRYDMLWVFVLGMTTLLTAATTVQYTRIGWAFLKAAKQPSQ